MPKPDPEALTPPDPNRCQAEVPNGATFMTVGGQPGRVRCSNKPRWIATEARPGKDGRTGSMSLCDPCRTVFEKQLGPEFAAFAPVVPKRRRRKLYQLVAGGCLKRLEGYQTHHDRFVYTSREAAEDALDAFVQRCKNEQGLARVDHQLVVELEVVEPDAAPEADKP